MRITIPLLATVALMACTTERAPAKAPVTPPGSHTTDIDTTGPGGLGEPSGFNSSPGSGSGGDTGNDAAASGRHDTAPIAPGMAQPQIVNPRKRQIDPTTPGSQGATPP